MVQQQPELAPLSDLENDNIFDVTKNLNFLNCKERSALHFGLTGLDDFEPGQNKMGEFLSVST